MVVLYQHGGSANHGCEAIVRSTAKLLTREMVLYSSCPEEDQKYGVDQVADLRGDAPVTVSKGSLRWLRAAAYRKIRGSDYYFNLFQHDALLRSVTRGDICFSIGGDNYCYSGADILTDVNRALHRKGAKTVLWGCSVEADVLEDPEIVADMKRYDVITARESITVENLKRAGIADNVVFCADPAFQLDVAETPLPLGFSKDNTIGINASPLAAQCGNLVMQNYTRLIEYILQETDCSVLLIPHVVIESTDDRTVLKELYDLFEDTGRVSLAEDRNCMELKGLISQCRLFVGARTHATVAAYSTCVPTLVAGYSVKARGIARDIFGTDEHYVVPVQGFDSEESLTNAFLWLWENEASVRGYLEKHMHAYCERSFLAVDAVKRLLDS